MPGRPEGPINPDARPSVRDLALRLRELRNAAGLTTSELSERAHVSPPTLSRAASGRTVPSWTVISAFADACGLDEQERRGLEALWQAAIKEQHVIPWTAANTAAATAEEAAREQATDQQQVRRALMALYEAAGRPSTRSLASESGVARSVVHRVVTGAFKQEIPARAAEVAEALLSHVEPGVRDAWADLLPRLRTPGTRATERPRSIADATPNEAPPGDARREAERAARRIAVLANQMAHGLANGELPADDKSVRVLRNLQHSVDKALQILASRSQPAPGPSEVRDRLSEIEASLPDPGSVTSRALQALEARERNESSREKRIS